jgi:hypothetical protein
MENLTCKPKAHRIVISKQESWLLTPKEVILIKDMIQCLKVAGRHGLTLTQLYIQSTTDEQDDVTKASDIHLSKRNEVKYLLMLLWKRNKVRIKSNNGFRLIKWRK